MTRCVSSRLPLFIDGMLFVPLSKVLTKDLLWHKTLQTLTLVHVFQRGSQDSLYVLAINDDGIKKFKVVL